MKYEIDREAQLRSALLPGEIRKAQDIVRGGPQDMHIRQSILFRAALAVLLMVGYLAAYMAFNVTGIVVVSLAGLLGLSHPFWLMKWKHRETKKSDSCNEDTSGKATNLVSEG